MSSNYPEGSMMGSGIYAEEIEREYSCDVCEKDVTIVFVTDDWGHNAIGECPDCSTEYTIYPEEEAQSQHEDWVNDQIRGK
jgi:hypothetical protein